MPKHGRQYREVLSRFDRMHPYSPREALELVNGLARARFDETVEAAYRLGIDPRRADQMVRGTVSLPHGTGKEVRVAVFAKGDKAREAEAAGADVVGGSDLVEKVAGGGELNFDMALATPDMMSEVGRLGRILGPRGLMPNPKAGSVTFDVGKAVEEFKAGRIEYRSDRYGNIHAPIGKVNFDIDELLRNLATLTAELVRARPAAAKGRYIRNLAVSSSMGPGVKVDLSRLEELTALAR